MTELNECDRQTKGPLCHRLSSALLIRINLAWLKMQMAQRHWQSLHVFIKFNWFNYMENEMVGSAIKRPPHPPASSPSCQSLQRDEYSLMPRRQGNEISRSSSRSFSFSISASRRPSGWFIEAGRRFFIVVIARNILVWVSEAPTLLCGPRA